MTFKNICIGIALIAILVGVVYLFVGLQSNSTTAPAAETSRSTTTVSQSSSASFDTSDNLDQALQDLGAIQ